MSSTLPKALLAPHRSSFALINPSTQLYYRKLDHSARQHVAISYAWSEWIDNSEKLPNWDVIRERLLCILGEGAPRSVRSETGGATRCWLDLKCIDQDCLNSKSYWIPRIDEIYHGAKCTVLLLRDPFISVLVPVAQRMKCDIKNKTSILHWPHSCLLSQSCTTFPEMPINQEMVCIEALRRLYDGAWRKRAWIFQEILLSKKYLLIPRDSEFIELGDIGVIATLLFQRHLNETWLANFSDWCRRLFYLRQFYAKSKYHHLSDANVLQMATALQATIPADKIYALCGILKFKDVPYDGNHSFTEAFQVVVGELTKKGRLSWLHAIPASLKDEPFRLAECNITPFVLTRLSDRLLTNGEKKHITTNSIGFPVKSVGQITRTKPLANLLQEASNWMEKDDSFDFPSELEYLYFVPKIIRRIALDVINPLLVDPLFGQICQGLDISIESGSRPTRAWRMIMSLYMKNGSAESPNTKNVSGHNDDAATILVWSAALSLQERLKILQDEFSVIWWHSEEYDKPETMGIGARTCKVGDYVCSIKYDSQFLVAASFQSSSEKRRPSQNPNSADARFRGMIYDLNSTMTIQWTVKALGIPFVVTPTDMQTPVIGDHPHWDRWKDDRYDKYLKTDASEATTAFSLLGKERNQPGRPICLNFEYNS